MSALSQDRGRGLEVWQGLFGSLVIGILVEELFSFQ